MYVSVTTYLHSWIWMMTLRVDLQSSQSVLSLVLSVLTIPLCLVILYDPTCSHEYEQLLPLSSTRRLSQLVQDKWRKHSSVVCELDLTAAQDDQKSTTAFRIARIFHEPYCQVV